MAGSGIKEGGNFRGNSVDEAEESPLMKVSDNAGAGEEENSGAERKSTSVMYYGILLYLHRLP